ncbi:MAG: sigma-54-dependent Fis family transcriptional regulator, partial [Bdellovibrionales bacterium]|nr:sigma-54-dependent Fis family transcriptional regulator [Bdellovibrionales bacterium]
FYRLNVLPIKLPPLRDRRNDIESLSKYFVEKFNLRYKKQIKGLDDGALAALKTHRWPGNIRELENVLEHAFVLESGQMISIDSLPEKLRTIAQPPNSPAASHVAELSIEEGAVPMEGEAMSFRMSIQKFDFQASKEEFEKQFLINALKAFHGKINQTAMHANIPKKTLLRKLEKYGISAKDYS